MQGQQWKESADYWRNEMKDSKRTIRIAAAGDNCIDAYDREKRIYCGGDAVNVAVYVKRLGGEAAYVGAVGTDEYGNVMKTALQEKGVDISHMKVLDGNTAVTHVEIADGERLLGDYDEGVMAQFRLEEKDIDFLCGYDVVVSGLWGRIEKDLPRLKEKNVTTAFDFATELDGPVISAAVPYVDYAFFSIDDKPEEEILAFIKDIQKRGPKVVVAMRGELGSLAYDGRRFFRYGIVPCSVADTMGAGDSFIAGFLYAVCEGKGIREAMEAGARSSSVTLSYSGAW